MKTFVVILGFLAIAVALPVDVVQDEEGQEYALVPLHRERRQLKWNLDQSGYGLAHTGTIFNNNKNKLDGTANAFKTWKSHGLQPDQYGGRLDFSNKPSKSSAFVSADKTRGWGTDVNAGVKYNFLQKKNWSGDVSGQYGRHFGGPGGTTKPQAGVFLNLKGNF